MKNRIFKLFSLLVLLSSFIQPAIFAASSDVVFKPELKMSINGVVSKFNYGDPAIENGRSLIPVRDLLVNLGVPDDDEHIIWDAKTRSVTIIHVENTIKLTVDSADIIKNDEVIQKLEVPAKIINNRVYLPARAVAEALDYSVSYDEKSQNIVITSIKPVDTAQPADPKPVKTAPVNNDTTAPTVIGVLASTGYQIEVVFSEPVDKSTAENVMNYEAIEKYGNHSTLNIVTAIQQADKTKVMLTTGPQQEALYTFTVSNVKDLNGNTVTLNSTPFAGSKGAPQAAIIDPSAPPIVSVTSPSKTTIEIRFGKLVDKASAEAVVNYSAHETYGLRTALAITGAKLQADGVTVILTTQDQIAQLYTLSVLNVTDSTGNPIVADKALTFVGFSQ